MRKKKRMEYLKEIKGGKKNKRLSKKILLKSIEKEEK